MSLLGDEIDADPRAFVLGKQYDMMFDKPGFQAAARALVWFSYRRGFPDFGSKPGHNTDFGWGCMIRSGQMLLAEAVRRALQLQADDDTVVKRRDILRLFADDPSAPFSIHRITDRGAVVSKGVGDWIGPNAMAQIIKLIVADYKDSPLCVHVAMNGMLCVEDVLKDCSSEDEPWKPLLLLIPLRLGLNELTESYIPLLQKTFTDPNTVGAVGGKPNSAFYFAGCRGTDTLYLDPHTLQNAVSMKEELFSEETYIPSEVNAMKLNGADPSLCLGYFFASREALNAAIDNFKKEVESHATPLFGVSDRSMEDGPEDDFAVSGEEDEDGFELL